MRVIVAGTRDLEVSMAQLMTVIEHSGFAVTELVSGHSGNIDLLGEQWARALRIPVRRFTASWGVYGLSAGPKRNRQMADYADALIALWDGNSRGTKNMIEEARKQNLDIYVEII